MKVLGSLPNLLRKVYHYFSLCGSGQRSLNVTVQVVLSKNAKTPEIVQKIHHDLVIMDMRLKGDGLTKTADINTEYVNHISPQDLATKKLCKYVFSKQRKYKFGH